MTRGFIAAAALALVLPTAAEAAVWNVRPVPWPSMINKEAPTPLGAYVLWLRNFSNPKPGDLVVTPDCQPRMTTHRITNLGTGRHHYGYDRRSVGQAVVGCRFP